MMRRWLLTAALVCALPGGASAQLLYSGGKPVTSNGAQVGTTQPAANAAAPATTTAPAASATRQINNDPAEAVIQGTNFPASAITDVGGEQGTMEPLTSTPVPDPLATAKGVVPKDSPEWPSDSRAIFVTACARANAELVRPCGCVIEHLARLMPHNQFVALSESGAIENDPRYKAARTSCLGVPERLP